MRSAKLAKLESLSETQAENSRTVMEQQRSELLLLDSQHQELKSINQEYQYGVVGQESISPQLLAHRRAFVEQLSQKLDLLQEQRNQQDTRYQESVAQFREKTAQTAAIGAMSMKVEEREQASAAKLEQRVQDDVVQSLRHIQTHNEDEERA